MLEQTFPQAEELIPDCQFTSLGERDPTPNTPNQDDPTQGNKDSVPIEKTLDVGRPKKA